MLVMTLVASIGLEGPVAASSTPLPRASVDVASDLASTTVPFATTTTDPVAEGVAYRHGRWTTTLGPQVVELIDVDPAAEGISLEVSGPAAGPNALETVRSQIARVSRNGHRVIGAINGDTFGSPDAVTRAPAGLQVHLGELITGSTGARPTLGFDADETPRIGDVSVKASLTLPDGVTKMTIDRVNKPRASGDFVLYTGRWGTRTRTGTGGAEVVLTGAALPLRVSGAWTATVASVLPTGSNTVIPTGSLVLSAHGTDAAVLAKLVPGSTVTVGTRITSGWEGTLEAIGGREWLVEGRTGEHPSGLVCHDRRPSEDRDRAPRRRDALAGDRRRSARGLQHWRHGQRARGTARGPGGREGDHARRWRLDHGLRPTTGRRRGLAREPAIRRVRTGDRQCAIRRLVDPDRAARPHRRPTGQG